MMVVVGGDVDDEDEARAMSCFSDSVVFRFWMDSFMQFVM